MENKHLTGKHLNNPALQQRRAGFINIFIYIQLATTVIFLLRTNVHLCFGVFGTDLLNLQLIGCQRDHIVAYRLL